jgi:hypothetical protein
VSKYGSMISTPANARDVAIADFFNALTGLVKLCEPLIKQAVAEAAAKRSGGK